MALDAGTVEASLKGDFKPSGFLQFDAAMKRSDKNVNAFERRVSDSSKRTSHALRTVGTAAGVGVAGGLALMTAGVVTSVKAYGDFNKQMQTVKAVSQASAAQMKALDTETKRIGTTTKYSATQAAQGSVELVKAGMSIKQVIGGGLAAALSLAAAGDLELADAAQYTADAMNLFGIQAKNASTIADGFATAANDTTADVSDFGMALTQGGSAAKMAGLSFTDTMVILESLAKAGIKNSDAGTSMKTALLQLVSPTKKQAALQKELGLSFVGANGKLKDGIQISKELQSATKNMSDAQRTAAFKQLAGTDGIRTLNALYAAGPKRLKDYETAQRLIGSAQRVAGEKMQGMAGAVAKSQAAFETAKVVIGEEFAPMVMKAADGFTEFIKNAQADGSLADFGEGLSDAAEDAANFGRELFEVGKAAYDAGAPLVHVISGIASALQALPDGSVAAALGGIAAAFVTMKVAGTVAPGIEAVTGALQAASAASSNAKYGAGLARELGQIAPLAGGAGRELNGLRGKTIGLRAGFASMGASAVAGAGALGPVGGIALAAGAAFTIYSMSQQRAADAARDAAAAIEAGGQAALTAGDEYRQAAQDQITAEGDKAALQDLIDARDKARKNGEKGRVKELNALIKQGELTVGASEDKADQSKKNAPIEFEKKLAEARGKTKALDEAAAKSANKLKASRETLSDAEKMGNTELIAEAKAHVAAREKQAAADQRAAEAQKRTQRAYEALKGLKDISAARVNAGKDKIGLGDAEGVLKLKDALKGIPKKVATKILVEGDSEALGKMGNLAASLKGRGLTAKVKAILEGDGSVKSKLKALERLASRDTKNRIKAILEGDGDARSKINALRKLKITDKRFNAILNGEGTAQEKLNKLNGYKFNPKTIPVSLSQSNFTVTVTPRGGTTKLNQAANGASRGEKTGLALVGEDHPREAVISGSSGKGFFTDGPMFTQLSSDDYVIPVDQKYRGRAMGLFGSLASDLGIPGYKKGKKGTGTNKASTKFPVPAKHNRDDAAMAMSLEDLQAKYENIKGRKKGKRKGLEKAKRAYLDAKKFSDSITGQEDYLQIAEDKISLASKNKDQGGYNAGIKDRDKALKNLNSWLTKAINRAPNGSKWEKELQKKLGGVKLSQKDVPEYAGADSGDYITKDEQDRLDKLDADEALAELTTTTVDDDRAALTGIQTLREQILARVQAAGAPSTVIADAAKAVKSARDAVTGLTQTTDSQAIIDQSNEKARVARKDADTNAAALRAFTGSGDLGSGGANAWSAAGGVTVNVNTLHPGDPQTTSALAGAVSAGVSAQGYVPTSRVKTGV